MVTMFEKIISDDAKTYDEKMLPLIIEDAKAIFEATIRNGQKEKRNLEKKMWDDIYLNPSDFNLDEIANNKLKMKKIDEKIAVIQELQKELFSEVTE